MFAVLLFLSFVVSSAQGYAATVLPSFTDESQAVIGYTKQDWQTYDFYPRLNQPVANVQYRWVVDGNEVFFLPAMRYFFEQGEHRVTMVATDGNGINRYDTLKLYIYFWSLHNASMWWVVYATVLLLIVYYWGAKVVYILNRRAMKRQVRQFLDVLDTHGFIDHMIEAVADKRDRAREQRARLSDPASPSDNLKR